MEQGRSRTAEEVVRHHNDSVAAGLLDEVMRDYSEESVVMAPDRTLRGLDAIRGMYEGVITGSPEGLLKAITTVRLDVHNEVVFAVWKAEPFIKTAADTFFVRDGKILVQTFLVG